MGRERKGERVRGSWARRGWGSGGVSVMACGLRRGGDGDGEKCLSGARGGSGRATGAAWEVRTFVVHLFFCFPSLLLLYSFFFLSTHQLITHFPLLVTKQSPLAVVTRPSSDAHKPSFDAETLDARPNINLCKPDAGTGVVRLIGLALSPGLGR